MIDVGKFGQGRRELASVFLQRRSLNQQQSAHVRKERKVDLQLFFPKQCKKKKKQKQKTPKKQKQNKQTKQNKKTQKTKNKNKKNNNPTNLGLDCTHGSLTLPPIRYYRLSLEKGIWEKWEAYGWLPTNFFNHMDIRNVTRSLTFITHAVPLPQR